MKSPSTINTTVWYEKFLGETPLEAVERFRREHPEYQQEKIAYAGRLDPMAEGVLLLLVGEACKERDRYLGLDKEYEFEVLLGVGTDTHDILGIIESRDSQVGVDSSQYENRVGTVLDDLVGKHDMPYPAFSSKTVEGKPLFLWALEHRLDEIDIPTKKVEIYRMECTDSYGLSAIEVHQRVRERIARVTAVTDESKALGRDFRRMEVLALWDRWLEQQESDRVFTVLQIRCLASSGTYMRVLADSIGTQLGTGGIAWSITRTLMGNWNGESIDMLETGK